MIIAFAKTKLHRLADEPESLALIFNDIFFYESVTKSKKNVVFFYCEYFHPQRRKTIVVVVLRCKPMPTYYCLPC